MALAVGQTRRHRSSTGASRTLNRDEEVSETANLIAKLSLIAKSSVLNGDAIPRASDVAHTLRKDLKDDASSKDIFRRGKGFDICLQLLGLTNKTTPEDDVGKLLRAILSLVSEGIRDHRGNDKYFAIYLNGWTTLQTLVLSLVDKSIAEHVQRKEETKDLPSPVFSVLLECAFGGEASLGLDDSSSEKSQGGVVEKDSAGDAISIVHPEAFAIAIRLALRLEDDLPPLGIRALQLAATIAHADERGKVQLWQTGILSDMLNSKLGRTISSSVASALNDLTKSLTGLGLNSLDDVSMLFQKACDNNEARTLLLQIAKKSKGPAFVQFDLALCGFSSIELPSLPRVFPPSTGYSLSAWIRIDAFDQSCHTTLFGAFDSSQKCFLLLYLEKDSQQLILQTSIRSSRPSVRFKSTRFATTRWYHVALVHRKSTTDPKQSSAVLFVDGEFAEQVKCAYPESPPEQERRQSAGSPGGTPGTSTRLYKPVQAFFGTPHDLGLRFGRNEVMSKWSLASAHLFQAPLTDEFVAVCHRLGPRYSGNMQDCLGPLLTYRASAELNRYNELLHPDKSDRSDIVTATESRGSDVLPEGRILVSICPTAVIDFDGPNSTHQAIKQDLDRKAYQRYTLLSQKSKAVAISTLR